MKRTPQARQQEESGECPPERLNRKTYASGAIQAEEV